MLFQKYLSEYKFNHNEIVGQLEDKTCEHTGSRYAIAVNSATSAILMVLIHLQTILKDGEILIPSYGYPAVYKACKILGLKPVVVDVDEKSLTIDLHRAEEKITDKTLAMFNIENNGVLGNLQLKKEFCSEHNIYFIEDAASAMVQNYNGQTAGTFGDIGIYSFSPTKVLNSGEGGVIITDSKELYTKLKELRYSANFSRSKPLSLNFNMSPFLAAMLIPQFESIEFIKSFRSKIHDSYISAGLKIFEYDSVSNYYPYAIYQSVSAREISEKLRRLKIGHRFQYYAVVEDCEVANKIKSTTIDLPLFHDMGKSQIETICSLIRRMENDIL